MQLVYVQNKRFFSKLSNTTFKNEHFLYLALVIGIGPRHFSCSFLNQHKFCLKIPKNQLLRKTKATIKRELHSSISTI